MSRDTRFDKLESEITDALRRAPGAEPSADLDARILARAHAAVAKPVKRTKPVWFSMAAGLVVLVGSGLALRIWQQLEHAPSALDAPGPAASTPAPAAPAPSSDDQAVMDSTATGAAAESSEREAPARTQAEPIVVAPAKPADQPSAPQPGAELRREQALIESKQEVMSDLGATPEIADQLMPAPQARPFPAEPAPVVPVEEQAATAASSATPAAQSVAPPPPSPAPVAAPPALSAPAAPPPMQAPTPAADSGLAQPASAGPAPAAKVRSEGAAVAGRDSMAPRPELDGDSERQRAAGQSIHDEAYLRAIAAVREAISAGDLGLARQLALAVRRDYPQQELPKDVLALVDAAR